MYTLYYFPSSASMAPHMVLEEIGAPYELALVDRNADEHKSVRYLKLNPSGLIPVLIDGDVVLTEAAAICLHLADCNPQANLVPAVGSAERAQMYKWLIYLTNTLMPESRTARPTRRSSHFCSKHRTNRRSTSNSRRQPATCLLR